jgi:prophage antirepressor-like protein
MQYRFLNINAKIMQRLTIELRGNKALKALKELEHENLIRIVREPDLNSYIFPGKPISNEDFRRWVEYYIDNITGYIAYIRHEPLNVVC